MVILAPPLQQRLSPNSRIRLINTVEPPAIIKATDGHEQFVDMVELFGLWLDSNFKAWGTNVPSPPTDETEADVYEMVRDSTFAQMCRGLRRVFFTQAQAIQVIRQHRSCLHSRSATLIPFTAGRQRLVANAFSNGDLGVSLLKASYQGVWRENPRYDRRHWIVLPCP